MTAIYSKWFVDRKPSKQFWHKIFSCPTFWQLKPAFTCPSCLKKYRCYWDGNDIEGIGINICDNCAIYIIKIKNNDKTL